MHWKAPGGSETRSERGGGGTSPFRPRKDREHVWSTAGIEM